MVTLFELSQIVATLGALEAVQASHTSPGALLDRHAASDWGTVPAEDAVENEHSLEHGFGISSVYTVGDGDRLWVITEADGSATTLLLPSECRGT